jgi:predicted ArsR family transcriptional regulator
MNPWTVKYERTLSDLVRILKNTPKTAREVARIMGCSRQTAYKRIQSLRERNYVLSEQEVKERSDGPPATAFQVVRRVHSTPRN